MPRRTRIHVPGIALHIVQRGHNRDACFFAEDDYQVYRHWLGEALKTTGCQLHAYVQMTNHVHLLLTPPGAGVVSQRVISRASSAHTSGARQTITWEEPLREWRAPPG